MFCGLNMIKETDIYEPVKKYKIVTLWFNSFCKIL